MKDVRNSQISLSTVHVRWSPAAATYVAWSDQRPELSRTDPFSSLAAIDKLLDEDGTTASECAPPLRPHPERRTGGQQR